MNQTVSPYWREASKNLNERAYGSPNSMNAVRLRIALETLDKYPKGRLLDAGCGAGATTTAALDAGWDVTSIDFSEDMVRETNVHLNEGGHERHATQASITDLSQFPDAEFDAVICLGVMYYIEDDEKAYREFLRVLKPGGILLCSMQNEFFDLFTFNRYTKRFFKRHFFPLLDGQNDGELADELDQALSSLMTHPNAPERHDSGSGRDEVFMRQDNPMTYPEKISGLGFETVSGPYYHGIHLVPPLLEKLNETWEAQSAEKQYGLARDWRGMFNAAHFLFEFRKNG